MEKEEKAMADPNQTRSNRPRTGEGLWKLRGKNQRG